MSFKTLSESMVALGNDVFGEEVSYTPDRGAPVSIKGIFDNAFVDIEGIVSLKPTLRIDLNDLDVTPGKGDTVEIEDVNYRVIESRLDGYGGSTLILQKA